MQKQIPVNKDEIYVIEITDINVHGEGIGRINNYTVFIQGGVPGDKIEVEIIKAKKNYGYGKINKIITYSPIRIEAKCFNAHKCGGCALQHINYEAQLKIKTQKVKDAIERIGKNSHVKINNTIGMERPYNYRNKAQYQIAIKDNKIMTGFYAQNSYEIIPTTKCNIQHQSNEKILKTIINFLEKNKIQPYDRLTHTGLIRNIMIRTAYETEEIMICLIINGEKIPHIEELKSELLKIQNIRSILLNTNTSKTNSLLTDKTQIIWGNPFIIDYIGEIKYQISARSFYQVNPIQTNILYNTIKNYADIKKNETVLDAYCGTGTISLYLAKYAKKIIGIEILEESINDAKQNATQNNISNVEFIVGRVDEVLPELYKKERLNIDLAIIDPPRIGCDKITLDTLIQINPTKIIYISCDPSTMARDLNILASTNYKLQKVQPIDMFCHTMHVECVILMTRKNC